MYGQGNNFAPPFGQGNQTPRPPFQQRSVTPNFQQGPPSTPFQYLHPPPLPGQHGHQSFHLPPRPPQVNFSNPALHSYPNAQQNTLWSQNAQRTPLPLSSPLAPPPLGPYRPNMFQPPVSYIGSTYTPLPTSQIPPSPPPLPPPPLPPSSPPPVPPSPPPTLSPKFSEPMTSVALGAASELPQNLKSGSDAADKSGATIEDIGDRNIGDDDNKHLIGRTTDKVDSPDFENISSEETDEFDPFSPPPKPERENLVRRIEVICRFIAKNGPDFEHMTRQKESENPEFGFLFGGEPGSEAAVAHEYFKWVKKKCLMHHNGSHFTVEIPKVRTRVQINTMDADVSPSVSDMEMEDDFSEPGNIHCETALVPEDHDIGQQRKNFIESNFSMDTVPTFSQLAEDEKDTGSKLSFQNDQPMLGNVVESLNTTPTEATKLAESGFTGVSYSPSLEDTNSIVRSPDELIKSASTIKLIPNYSSDDSSEHENKPLVEDVAPMTMPLSNTTNDTSLYVDRQSKDVLDVVHEVALEEKKPLYQIEDVKRKSVIRKVDEFGRWVRDVSSGSDRDESYRTRKHGKRGRTRSRSPHDRRSRRSPRRRREKRSRSRSWSPKRRNRSRSRSRSPSYRRGIETGREKERKDKGRLPDCMDFLRGRCYRGESCRYMHHETDKSANNNRNMRTNIREGDKRGEIPVPGRNSVQTIVSDQVDKTLVAGQYKSEKSSESAQMVLENSGIKEDIFEDLREKEESDHAVNRSSSRLIKDGVLVNSLVETSFGVNSTTEELITEKSLVKNSEPELNKNAFCISNQGAYFEPPAPSLPHLLKEMVQPPTSYPYQGHLQTQPPQYHTPPNNWPPPPPPPFQQNQFPPGNNCMMFPHHSYPAPSSQIEDTRLKPLCNFPVPSVGLPTNQLYPINNFPLTDPSATNSQNHAYSAQQPQYNYGNINAPFGGSKISLHYNPYASAFDQPIDSKFSSNVLDQAQDLAVISPLKTVELPKSASDQYDPLFDSIEPSSNSFKKLDQVLGLESTLRLSSSRKELAVGENSREKEVDTAPKSTSMKSNEEFGETVEEVEIDQMKSPEKEQKNKDSKSMKLFKSSLAEYVKEVLKPHWRQGGMSKEAFKIIVKKTIDKVSGAMKSHHIPKSQEKINRYIDSSERKLNKLVMGYVDKYAKT